MKLGFTSRTSTGSATVESTSARSVILKQIIGLQKLEAGLSEQLTMLGTSASDIQQRLALQQQIQGIESQIKALQNALLQPDADRGMLVVKPAEEQTSQAPSSTTAQENKVETVGSVINTIA